MYKHIYCVPTHRLIEEENLNDYFMEVRFANKKYNLSIPLIIFEDNLSEVNRYAIYKMNQKYRDVDVRYITRKHVMEIYTKITNLLCKETALIFGDLYPNSTVNYGNVLNRIFIFALLFGANYISRRDSDVLVGTDINGKIRYPIENEIDFLGKKVDDKIIYICGGGYTGKYSMDIESFICEDDYTKIKRLFSCLSIPEEFHDEIIEVDVLQSNHVGQDIVTPNADDFPHCGNVSLFKLHKYLPCSPQNLVIGSDCFFIEVTAMSNLSLALHSRAVLHRHTSERNKEYSSTKRYWLGFLMYIDSQIFYRNFYERYIGGKDYSKTDFSNISKEIGTDMNTLLDVFPEKFKDIRYKKYMDCIALLQESNNDEIVRVGKEYEENPVFDEIISLTTKSVRKHAAILASWDEVVNACKILIENPYVMEILKSSRIEKLIK